MSDIFMLSRSADKEQALGNDHASAAHVAADWLCLAATPTFAILALLTAFGGGEPETLCAATQHVSPLGGMILMYLTMSAFHSAPWLKLIWGRGGATEGEQNRTTGTVQGRGKPSSFGS